MRHGFGILCLFFLSILFPSPSSQKVDPQNAANCKNMELEETCQTMEIAKMCRTTPFCIHCIWNTAFDPYWHDEEKCSDCQNAVKKGNSSNQDLLSLMETGCSLHKTEEKKSICSNLVQTFANRSILWDVDQTNVSSFEICSLLGFCYSKFKIIFNTKPPSFCTRDFRENYICRISGKVAAEAKAAKVYSLGTFWDDEENGNYYLADLYFPIFTDHKRSKTVDFRQGPNSEYSCQFSLDTSPLVIYFFIFYYIAWALFICIFCCSRYYKGHEILKL